MFNPKWYVNSRIDGFAVLEFTFPDDPVRRLVPLRSTHLSGSILGPFAEFTLTHTFRFSRDQCPHTIEALYRFPLPGDAAVTGVTVTFGETVITATLKARDTAEKEYEEAKKEGKSSALLTRESPDVFTLRVAGIAPDEDVIIRTTYVQTGEPTGPGFSFRIPLTTPPRYLRGDERLSRSASAQPLAVLRDPGHRFSMEVTAPGTGTVSSTSHSLTKRDDHYLLESGDVIPDRDCVLIWNPFQDTHSPSLQILTDNPTHPHFLALITPPKQTGAVYPRELIFLVDHSGSMDGVKWKAADRAVENLLRNLHPDDFFNLCLFESAQYWFRNEPVPATQGNVGDALRFLGDTRSGGTELGVALEQALRQPGRAGEISRHLIIITDAQVTDQARILQLVKQEGKQEQFRRCSILCIDSAPNSGLASNIARNGRGLVRFLTSTPGEEELNSALDYLVTLWNAPSAINLTLEVNRKEVIVPDHTTLNQGEESTTIDLGDLIPGRSTWLYGRCGDGSGNCSFTISGIEGSVHAEAVGGQTAIRFIYGANIVASLDFLMNSALSPEEISQELSQLGYDVRLVETRKGPIYHENIRGASLKKIKDLLISESLAYGIASSETAFIAVRQEADRVVEESIVVASALPSGWSDHFMKASSPVLSMIMQPDGTLKSPLKKARQFTSGGNLLEWAGSGGGGGIILPPHKTPPDAPGGQEKKGIGVSILPPFDSSEGSPLTLTLFKGRPVFSRGEAVLFDSGAKGMQNVIPRGFHLRKIIFSITEFRPEFVHLRLMLFIGDVVRQVIDIPLSDLETQGGEVPVLVTRKHGALIRLLLMDVSGKPTLSMPEMSVSLEGEVRGGG